MNKLSRNDLVLFLKIAIGIALIIIALKFFISFLPYIIVFLLILIIYDSLKKNNIIKFKKEKKDDGIKEAEIISERKND